MKKIFSCADILLPDFEKVSGTKWACIACDQYTSEPQYWENTKREIGDSPSTLDLILPEVYLAQSEARLESINKNMEEYLKNILISHPNSMLYIERTQSDGKIRRGIIGAVDLEEYDYKPNSKAHIRATEGTVLERIPPRVRIRKDACIELPHVMLLIDDDKKTVIEKIADIAEDLEPAYEFSLMQNAGKVKACWLGKAEKDHVIASLSALVTEDEMERKYGDRTLAPLLFAVGDGNHSLATAKECYEQIKADIGEENAKNHPSRYALAEIVNLHDGALEFEPIYRVVFNVNAKDLICEMKNYEKNLCGNEGPQKVEIIRRDKTESFVFEKPRAQLTVATLQRFLDEYKRSHPEIEIDYIHGESSVMSLTKDDNTVGFIFNGMGKDQLFKTVLFDGALPRKTFSMGHADDKRFYIESRKIK